MLSSCRTSSASYRSIVATVSKAQQQIPLAQARSGHQSASSSSPSASTSRLDLASNSSRNYHFTVKRSDEKRTKPLDFDDISPAVNAPLTPKAAQTVEEAQAWLNDAFPQLPLPDDIAMTMITHESWDHGMYSGHNRRLAFLGEC